MRKILNIVFFIGYLMFNISTYAEILVGSAKIPIDPFTSGLKVQLGGYGDRAGKPAEGVHDTTYAKVLILYQSRANEYLFIITMDVCHIPWSVVTNTIKKTNLPFLNEDNLIIMASHTHAGLEGMSMDERNILGNPHIGIFDPQMLDFVSSKLAELIKNGLRELYPVSFSSKTIEVKGLNKNRRNENSPTDTTLNILRFDRDGNPWIIFVNFTAHETIMTPNEMLLSAGYPGIIQRTIETFYPGTTCMFSNGAEGDVAPTGYFGASAWEKMENYGLTLAKVIIDNLLLMNSKTIEKFQHEVLWVQLPEKTFSPDFFKIAGDEYQVSEDTAKEILAKLFPDKAPMHAIRINDSAIITFPGEPITAIGLSVKDRLKSKGINCPILTSLTNDLIGYILTEDEYNKSGYEVTVSFYGPKLGELITNSAYQLVDRITK